MPNATAPRPRTPAPWEPWPPAPWREVETQPVDPSPDQVAALIYTSGTTGTPKGVMLTHRGILYIARVSGGLRQLAPGKHVYGVLPTAHVFGLSSVCAGALANGACLYAVPRFSAAALVDALARERIAILQGVPAMYARTLEYLDHHGLALEAPALEYMSAGGAPLDPDLKRRVERVFGGTLHNGYGLTETSPTVSQTRVGEYPDSTTVGKVLPGLEYRLLEPATEAEAAPGEVGELWIRGPTVMKGYFRNEEATRAVLRSDGWLDTGDLARLDERGQLYIVGRSKELIIRSGFNVYPPDVEAVINEHPQVTLSAVVGRQVPGNEEVVAYVQRAPGSTLTVAELAAYAAERLAAYKRPSEIVFLDELPATSTGKILKGEAPGTSGGRPRGLTAKAFAKRRVRLMLRPSLARLRPLPLPLLMGLTLARIAGGPAWLSPWADAALALFLIVEWPEQGRLARIMLVISGLVAAGVALSRPDALALFAEAADRFAFYGTFIACLGMLRVAAQDSALVRRCGVYLIRQPPRWRYATLALGSAMFGLVLNLGVVALLGVMSLKGNTLAAAGGHEIVREVRGRRMLVAVLRGFALVPLISPLGIALAVILSTMPQVRWANLFPVALGTALLLFVIGWVQDRLSAPTHLADLVPPRTESADPRPLLRFILLLTGVIVFTVAVSLATGARMPVAVLFTVPLSAFVWFAVQRRRLAGGLGLRRAAVAVRRRAHLIFPALRGEIAILGSAGFMGALLAHALPRAALAHALVASGVHGPLLATAATLLVVVGAQLGLNPIVGVTLLASVLPDPHAVGLAPELLATALMAGWSLAMVSSPLTASMLILARLAERSPYAVGWRWNGPFLIAALVALGLWYFALSAWCTAS